MKKNTWFAKFQRTLGAFFPVEPTRAGGCVNCGACCALPVRCPFLKERDDGRQYCAVYFFRPLNCRKYPRTDEEFITQGTCGFSFERGGNHERFRRRRMPRPRYATMLLLGLLGILVCLAATISAQEREIKFIETREDFLKVLGARTKAIKGPGAVVDDDSAKSLILFDYNSDVVKKESYPILRNLASVLTQDLSEVKLLIVGNTDNQGDATYNQQLSERRAQAVKDFLVYAYGIAAERLQTKGYGEENPLIKDNPADAKNRRVEFFRLQ